MENLIQFSYRINAFELTSFLSGTLINRICDLKIGKMIQNKSQENGEFKLVDSEQFTSNKNAEEIVNTVNIFQLYFIETF